MIKTVTIKIPAPPKGYGQPVLGVPSGPHVEFFANLQEWIMFPREGGPHCIHAMEEGPWYPQDWIDDPKLGVHEVARGEWPPCKPGDVIEALLEQERKRRIWTPCSGRADQWSWGEGNKVAIRIIRRAGDA